MIRLVLLSVLCAVVLAIGLGVGEFTGLAWLPVAVLYVACGLVVCGDCAVPETTYVGG